MNKYFIYMTQVFMNLLFLATDTRPIPISILFRPVARSGNSASYYLDAVIQQI